LKLYNADKPNVYHLLPKGTEGCMKPCAWCVMKVSLAVQFMSLTVAAAINTLVTVGKDNCTMSRNDTQAYQQCCYMMQLFVKTVKTVPG
jgi:tRNA A37 methylthiotransferase MiaB